LRLQSRRKVCAGDCACRRGRRRRRPALHSPRFRPRTRLGRCVHQLQSRRFSRQGRVPVTALRLDKLSLTNFRCFSQCEVDLHPYWGVLGEERGGEKPAVLDAAAAALSVFVNALYPLERIKRIERSDVRLVPDRNRHMTPSLPTEYEVQGIVLDVSVKWKSTV